MILEFDFLPIYYPRGQGLWARPMGELENFHVSHKSRLPRSALSRLNLCPRNEAHEVHRQRACSVNVMIFLLLNKGCD